MTDHQGACRVGIFHRQPSPPFIRTEGPFAPNKVDRFFALTDSTEAKVDLALTDIGNPSWLLPGNCWSIESDCEEPFVGFIAPGEIDMDALAVTLSLEDPITALLSVEAPLTSVGRTEAGGLVSTVLLAGQSGVNLGVEAGTITSTPVVDIAVRGETIAALIDALAREAGVDYRIRARLAGARATLLLDFGSLAREVSVTIVKEDIVAGKFRQSPITSSLTLFGEGSTGFDSRPHASSSVDVSRLTADRSTSGPILPASEALISEVVTRNIGPAAVRHMTQLSERQSDRIADSAEQQLSRQLASADELYLTVQHGLLPNSVVGDVVNVNVLDWIPGLSIVGKFQIRHIAPQEATGERDLMLWRVPSGR